MKKQCIGTGIMNNYSFRIAFSGFSVRFKLPCPIELPDELSLFLSENVTTADAEYEICLLKEPLKPQEPPVCVHQGTKIYRTNEGWLRIYPLRIGEDGCQVACLLCPNGKNILYYPLCMWDYYSKPLHCLPQLGIEYPLLRRNAFMLHSSVVELNGKTVLFAGPAAVGKSTQAQLWETHLGAKILNGDRCIVMQKPDGFYGGGSPWCGSSKIYHREQYPIAGIFLVNQAPDNSVQSMGVDAFLPLFSQTLINSWDTEFMNHIMNLYQDLLNQIPIYRLNCRPDEGAVQAAFQALF